MILKSLCLRAAAEKLRAPLTLDAGTMAALSQLLALQAAQIAQGSSTGPTTKGTVNFTFYYNHSILSQEQ